MIIVSSLSCDKMERKKEKKTKRVSSFGECVITRGASEGKIYISRDMSVDLHLAHLDRRLVSEFDEVRCWVWRETVM